MTNATLEKRERMVAQQIEARGITDPRLLAVMREIPRERFVAPDSGEDAYEDRPLPIQEGQTISQPYIVALMCDAAKLTPASRVLEIGAGSGYSAAVLSRLVSRVWTIERNPRLARFAGARIAELGMANVTVLRADGTLGWPPAAPFDAIIVTAGGPEVPDTLKQQLLIGGRLIMPVGSPDAPQQLVRVVRTGEQEFTQEVLADVQFVPLIGEHGWRA